MVEISPRESLGHLKKRERTLKVIVRTWCKCRRTFMKELIS